MIRYGLIVMLACGTLGACASGSGADAGGDGASSVAAIDRIPGVTVKDHAFKGRGWKHPTVLDSAEEAAAVLDEAGAQRVAASVDFATQKVLVFAWRGSGGDVFSYAVGESYPEQVFFGYRGGMTRDLRPHVYVYALRKNVRWRVAEDETP